MRRWILEGGEGRTLRIAADACTGAPGPPPIAQGARARSCGLHPHNSNVATETMRPTQCTCLVKNMPKATCSVSSPSRHQVPELT